MATRIKLKRSTTAASVPTTSNLEDGEVALNIADRKLYARNGANIIEVANQKPNTGEVVTTMLASDITDGQGNTWFVAKAGSDTTTLANGGAAGKHPDTPFLTITKALSVATSGDTIVIAPGEYQEVFPMTVPDGITVRGTNLRSTSVKPTTVTNTNNAFILSGDCHLSDLTIKEFFYDSGNDKGYAFVLVSTVNSEKSPYIERVTVTTKGSVTSASDPYGFAQGDAGRGAKLDGASINAASQHAAVLFNECTFITPNQIGLLLTNGIRCEWLNSFNYFASIGIQGVQGATGKYGTGQTRLKLGGTSGTFSATEVAYQLEDSFQSGTYARATTTVTLTRTGHGLASNDYIYADHISGGATDNFYQVTVVDANTFTYTDSASGTIASGNVTYKKAVARGLLASNDGTYVYISGKGTGEFVTTTKPAKTTSRFGDSQIDTAQKKFGTASILLDGTEDNVKVPTSEDFGFGTSNWCLEAFIRPNSVTGTQHIFDLRDASSTDTAPKLYLNGSTLHFGVGNSSVRSGGTLSTGTWYHVAVARQAGTTKLFLDGVELGTGADTNDYGSTKPVVIGSDYQASPTEAFNGWIDEVRISKGAARFTAAFTPTTGEYSSDLNTVLLLHSNGDDASTTFTDSSGGTSDIRSSGGDSATSVITADYSQFGAELRSVASACVYGTKGIQADGSGVKLLLTAHNFAYVGAGADYTNDPSLAVQANEVEELNSGKVFYSSTDQDGDFRVGDAFTVDQTTGNVQFQATSTAQSAANITLSDGTGTTNIYPAYIETGNLRLAGNSITSTTGQVIVDPSGNEDFVVNAETIVKEAVYFDTNKSVAFGSVVQGTLNITGFSDATLFGSSEASCFSTRSLVVYKNGLGTINLVGAGTGYEGGAQQVNASSNPFQLATATCTLNTTGTLKSVTITARGRDYTIAPDITLSGTGGGTVQAQLGNAGRLVTVGITNGGSSYAGPTVTLDPPPQNSFTADSTTVSTSANTITVTDHNFETGDLFTYDATTLDATATAIGGLTSGTSTYCAIYVDNNTFKVAANATDAGNGTEISLTSAGSGIQMFTGVQATATLGQTGGVIDATTITNAGTGYGQSINGAVSDSGSGAGAQLTYVIGRNVTDTQIVSGGSYTAATTPTVTVTNNAQDTTGTGATGTATVGFPVDTVTLTGVGLGYRNNPTVVVSTGDATTDASFSTTLDEKTGRISSITKDADGENYTSAPTLTISGGAGSGAILEVNIQSLTGNITAAGSGYAAGSYPNTQFSGGTGTNATATFTVSGFAGTITTAGTGYADGTYTAALRNPPTTTYTVTVVSRNKLAYSGGSGTFQVGETVTGSVSGATAAITVIGTGYVYVSTITGTFQDAQTDTITGGTSGATGTLDLATLGVNRYLINGNEGASLTLIDNNTYKFDTSDPSNATHQLIMDQGVTNLTERSYGTLGTAGSYWEITVQSVSSGTASAPYKCQTHGIGMSEPGVFNFTTGAAGQSGLGMTISATVTGGAVATADIAVQSSNTGNYATSQTFFIDDADFGGGGGSGFVYTLTSESTGIASVTDISLVGSGYTIGDVLSVADADVGGGGGSGFQYTVTNVGFCTSATVNNAGQAFETSDTLVLGDVGTGASGSGLQLSIATIASTKTIELSQDGLMTLGDASSTQLVLNPTGALTASNWSVSAGGMFTGSGITLANDAAVTGNTTLGGTLGVTGLITGNGGINAQGAASEIDDLTAKLSDGTAAAPSLTLKNSPTTGFYRADADKLGITVSGTQFGQLSSNGLDLKTLVVDQTVDSTTPFFKVDSANTKVSVGSEAKNLYIGNDASIVSDGTDLNVDLNFDTKGQGNFVFKGGASVDFTITDGTSNVVSIDTGTGTSTFLGNLDAGILRLRDNVVGNNSSAATRSFGQVLGLAVTGSGSGYTDGTYTGTATTTSGDGSGCTVTVTVSGGDFSAVTVVTKGQNYRVGDTLTITAAGGGSGRTVTINDIDGSGLVLKPGGGFDVLVDTTGALVVPAGTTNERPDALDRRVGGIRFNTTQLQFEGYNGTDFVSLGGVRDVDQDTYVLTEASPGSDEDVFEFFNTGVNSLSIAQDKFTLKTAKTFDVQGTLIIDGITANEDPIEIRRGGNAIAKFRDKKDFEISDGANAGLRLRRVPTQGTVATIGTVTSNGNAYTASTTFTAVATTSNFEGTGATVTVVTNGSGGISTVTLVAGGVNYEVDEVIKVAGNLLGGVAVTDDITFPVATISNTQSPYSRLDVIDQDFVTRTDGKSFISLDANGSESQWKINRGWASNTESYLTVFDSTATFMELDDARVEGGQLTSFATTSFVQFDKTAYKGGKTLITIESDDNKVQMLEVTTVCGASGTVAHATITNSITSDNDLVDGSISVVGNNVTISLNKSSAATSSTSFTGRFTTTKVKV